MIVFAYQNNIRFYSPIASDFIVQRGLHSIDFHNIKYAYYVPETYIFKDINFCNHSAC